jgi:hypothetical protein
MLLKGLEAVGVDLDVAGGRTQLVLLGHDLRYRSSLEVS